MSDLRHVDMEVLREIAATAARREAAESAAALSEGFVHLAQWAMAIAVGGALLFAVFHYVPGLTLDVSKPIEIAAFIFSGLVYLWVSRSVIRHEREMDLIEERFIALDDRINARLHSD